MSFGWLVLGLACESVAYAILTRRWHRAALLELADMADKFARGADFVAFALVHLIAVGVGLFFAWETSSWIARAVVFVAFFWATARPLRFISLLVVVRYAGILPAHILENVPIPQARRDSIPELRAEALLLMGELQLDDEIKWKLKSMSLLGEWANEEEQISFLKYIRREHKALNRQTFEAGLLNFRAQLLLHGPDEYSGP
jgi:hypothetical protein